MIDFLDRNNEVVTGNLNGRKFQTGATLDQVMRFCNRVRKIVEIRQ